jgi:hypothetical protein
VARLAPIAVCNVADMSYGTIRHQWAMLIRDIVLAQSRAANASLTRPTSSG